MWFPGVNCFCISHPPHHLRVTLSSPPPPSPAKPASDPPLKNRETTKVWLVNSLSEAHFVPPCATEHPRWLAALVCPKLSAAAAPSSSEAPTCIVSRVGGIPEPWCLPCKWRRYMEFAVRYLSSPHPVIANVHATDVLTSRRGGRLLRLRNALTPRSGGFRYLEVTRRRSLATAVSNFVTMSSATDTSETYQWTLLFIML
jgi:hypothetical protein